MIRRRPWLCQLSFRRIFSFWGEALGQGLTSLASPGPISFLRNPTMEILPWLRQSFSDVSSAPAPRFSPLVGPKEPEPEIDPSVMAEIPSRSPAPLSATETILNKVKSYSDPRKAISLAAELIADPTNFLPQLKGSKIAAGAIGTFFAKNSPFWNPRLATAALASLNKGARREDIFFDTNTWVFPSSGKGGRNWMILS